MIDAWHDKVLRNDSFHHSAHKREEDKKNYLHYIGLLERYQEEHVHGALQMRLFSFYFLNKVSTDSFK